MNRILHHLHLPQLRLTNLYPNLAHEMLENNLAVAAAPAPPPPPPPPPPPVPPFNLNPLTPPLEDDK